MTRRALSAAERHAQDVASDSDAAWFAANPDRNHRIRRAIFAEVPLDPDYLTYVAVRQVKPGIRMRLSFKMERAAPHSEAPEDAAATIFADIMERHGSAQTLKRIPTQVVRP